MHRTFARANVRKQVQSVSPYKYAKLQDGKLLLVDPTTRVVVGIITPGEGSVGRGQGTAPSGSTGQGR